VRTAAGRGIAVVWNDAAYGAEVHVYGRQGLAEEPMRIPETDFAALATAVGAEGVVVRELADLERLATWTSEQAGERRFLVLDCRVSPRVVAPYLEEVLRANSRR
jgi:thiamine pyrophosphate-dependent acetolactate synthase large subunit-like protein